MKPVRPLVAVCCSIAAVAILSPSASAVPIHRHMTVERVVGHDPNGPLVAAQEIVQVVNVAPPDSDDDGCKNADDHFNGPGCNPPPPPPAPAPVESVQPAPVTTSAPTTTTSTGSYSIPSYIVQCESGGSYTAQNPSGAYGAYQIMPSTASAYGCDLSTASGQDQCAASIYADVGSSAWSCG